MTIWPQTALQRILPHTRPQANRPVSIAGARGEVIAFQVGFRPQTVVKNLTAEVTGPLAGAATVRLAQLVPLLHHTIDTPARLLEGVAPGFVPDPLVPLADQVFDPGVSRSLWITIRLPRRSSVSSLQVKLTADGVALGSVRARVKVHPISLPPLKIPVTQYLHTDAIADWYRVEPFSGRYWRLVETYFRNMTDHHSNCIYTPMFTPPLDKVKRDLQLVDVTRTGPDRYRFGWGKLRRWIRLAQDCGYRYFEMSHLASQWGAKHAIRILVRDGDTLRPLCSPKTAATAPVYVRFLEQFLPALLRFLDKMNIRDRCFFHISDEPSDEHLESYGAIREVVRRIAPDIQITEALSHFSFYKSGLVENPVPVTSSLKPFLDHGLTPWTYYCCSPRGRHSNRFLDYPLYRLRMIGSLIHRFNASGFLHWAANYWYRFGTTELIDPLQVQDGHAWPTLGAGDTFIIYPGPDGPIDSVRWETFRAAFDDVRLLEVATRGGGSGALTALLDQIKAPDRFPQGPQYIEQVRAALLVRRG